MFKFALSVIYNIVYINIVSNKIYVFQFYAYYSNFYAYYFNIDTWFNINQQYNSKLLLWFKMRWRTVDSADVCLLLKTIYAVKGQYVDK